MKMPEIKRLAQSYSLSELKLAEEAMYEEQAPSIEVHGDDEGEKLTHILAAQDLVQNMEKGMTINEAIRAYSQRVRNSIS
jgi:hypothetical protein